jgi:hypothetical protein
MDGQLLDEQEYSLHRRFAVNCFNATWSLMERPDRSPDEDDQLLYTAFASCYHWSMIGTPANKARGEWQVSRVYTVLGRPEAARHHALRCLQVCQEHGIGDWDLGFAYEALARAAALAGDAAETRRWLAEAIHTVREIVEEDDRQALLKDLGSIPGFTTLQQE